MAREFLDLETGELIEVASYKTPEQVAFIKKQKEIELYSNRSDAPFVFTEMDLGGLEKMNNKDLGYFLVLQTYVNYENMLRLTADSNLPMTRKEMQQALKINSNKTLVDVLKRFKENNLITEEKIERYGKSYTAFFINPQYAFRKGAVGSNSDRRTDAAVKVFMDELQDVYAQGNTKPADIGFIYKCIPYLNYDSNFLTKNPDESDYSKVEFLTQNDLAEVQGMSRQKIVSKLSSIVYNGMYVFARVRVGGIRDVRIKVNPFVIYRKAGMPKELGIEFYVKPKAKK